MRSLLSETVGPEAGATFGILQDYIDAASPVQAVLDEVVAHEAELKAQLDEYARQATQQICARTIGKVVTAAKLRDPESGCTIGIYEPANPRTVKEGRTFVNGAGKTSGLFITPDLLPRERKQIKGVGVGVDLEHNSLVVRSPLLPGIHYWVKLFEVGSSDPLVALDIREPRRLARR